MFRQGVIKCVSDDDIAATFFVMQQLRSQLQENTYVGKIRDLIKNENYQLIALFQDNICLAVAGYCIHRRLYNDGKPEIYVDDLVTDSAHRSQGYGKGLINWLKIECKKQGYIGISLDSGNQRIEAHRFYDKEGMQNVAFHFYRPRSPDLTQSSSRDFSS